MISVAVIIPNWNGKHLLADCLTSLAAQTFRDFQAILVDNASTDGSADYVRQAFPWVRVLQNQRNLGFAGGVNQAIRESYSRYVVTLNNDVRLEPAWLGEMVRTAEAEGRVGMLASKLLLAAAPGLIDAAGIALDRAGFAWNLSRGEKDDAGPDGPQEVFGPCAGAALYRREMLEEIGLFDEDFFAFLEDADLAWRARLAGWRCLYVPTARAYHLHSATAGQTSSLKAYLLARNRIWLLLKNCPMPQLLAFLPLAFCYDVASLLANLALGKGGASLRGRWDALWGLGPILRKRRQVRVVGSDWARYLRPLGNPWKGWRREQRLRALAARASLPNPGS